VEQAMVSVKKESERVAGRRSPSGPVRGVTQALKGERRSSMAWPSN
jgi:hypothetical protein